MKDIISISDNAAIQIKKILSTSPKNVNGVIVGIDKAGCSGYSYKIDYATNENSKNFELIESKGVKIYVEPTATMYLIGSIMDYSKDKIASRFVFNNPNEKSSCGCGESFTV
tara:strand:+ start:387 stop:722 length:336 start_codon:yes stop_codon:yes gene_type:complete